jgi:hypothetical protein
MHGYERGSPSLFLISLLKELSEVKHQLEALSLQKWDLDVEEEGWGLLSIGKLGQCHT